jgi:hypothetical protein
MMCGGENLRGTAWMFLFFHHGMLASGHVSSHLEEGWCLCWKLMAYGSAPVHSCWAGLRHNCMVGICDREGAKWWKYGMVLIRIQCNEVCSQYIIVPRCLLWLWMPWLVTPHQWSPLSDLITYVPSIPLPISDSTIYRQSNSNLPQQSINSEPLWNLPRKDTISTSGFNCPFSFQNPNLVRPSFPW